MIKLQLCHFSALPALFILVFIKLATANVIILPNENNHSLGEYLCHQGETFQSNTTFILQSNVTHVVSPTNDTNTTGSVCIVRDLSDITVVAETHPVTVTCIGTYLATRRGFVFHNVSHLSIRGINFKGCGGILDDQVSFLNDTVASDLITSRFYFGICHSSALAFHDCDNLSLSDIQVTQYQGFGIMLLDSCGVITLKNITVHEHVSVYDAPKYCYPSINSGGGLLIYYHAAVNIDPTFTINVHITDCRITGGYTDNYGASLFDTIQSFSSSVLYSPPLPIVSAGGLTVMIRDGSSHTVNVDISNLYIANNTGLQAGGALILYLDVLFSNVKLSNVTMTDNCIIDPVDHYNVLARSLMVHFLSIIKSAHTSIDASVSLIMNNATIGGVSNLSRCSTIESGLGSYTYVLIRQASLNDYSYAVAFSNVTFKPMVGSPNRGASTAIYASTIRGVNYATGLAVQLNNITACNFKCLVSNSFWSCVNFGVMAFAEVYNISIIGGRFSNTTGSSVIYSKYSSIYLSQDPVFSYNNAETYGVISLAERSYLYFVEPLHAIFKSNRALLGASIYGVEDNVINCVLQYYPVEYYDVSNYTKMNIVLEMDANTAELAGNVLYGSPIKRCFHDSPNLDSVLNENITKLIDSTFVLQNNNNHSNVQDISSTPSLVCDCIDTPSPCKSNFTIVSHSAHPGKRVNISIAAFDVDQKITVYSLVTAQFYSHGIRGVTSLHLDPQDVITRIQPGICTTLSYTVYHSIDRHLTSYPISNVQLDVGPYAVTPRYVINLTLVDCPLGFQQVNSTCACIYERQPFNLVCDNQGGFVYHPPNSWIGCTTQGYSGDHNCTSFGYSSQCPPSYCRPSITLVNLSVKDDVCFGGRSGTLCGSCPEGLSVVFGSAECQKCSNAYLLTILLYAVAGILLVFVLFLLQMTLASGTINGLIFYVNILGSTDGYLFGHENYLYYLKIFVALLNFELGFPLCFYHGMNEVVLRCLQFVFPIYIWTIVIMIIVLSRYSSRLAKITGKQSVAVLATLIYLSYSKITITIVNTLTSATVITQDGDHFLVWYFHGHLKFGQGLHLLPMFLSLAMLCLFVIPFTIITTLSPFLIRFRIVNRFMPLTDAVFAPYKDKWRFWFGARLCLLVTSFVIAAVLRGSDVKLSFGLQLVLVVAFSLVQAFVHPFKNTMIAILDLSFMINYSLLAFIGVYIEEQNKKLRIASLILVSLALVVFIGIVLYHCYVVISHCLESRKHKTSFKEHSINDYGTMKTTEPATHSEIPEVHDYYDQYREPLLSEKHN